MKELKSALAELVNAQPTMMVMAEMTPRRTTFVLERGQYDRPTDIDVTPGIPEVLGDLPQVSPAATRLTLARWLVSKENPLTARVAVNRYWQMFFGEGLVRTPDNFGSQGALPTHPALLDWLATEFIRLQWNVKALQKLIVTSATYQQSSRSKESWQVGPSNRLLGRGPRLRLPAEMIRDQALAVSGLLVRKLGGPSVRPYQPKGLWDDVVYENVPRFVQDHGDKLYRRSMYTYWKRSVPPPNLQVLDAPSREACVLKRSRTNTPQAALVLMNDPTFVEAARNLAEGVMTSPGPTTQRIDTMFRRVTARNPSSYERDRLMTTLETLRADYQRNGAAAKALLGVGESPANEKLNPAELAALTAIANVMLGLDEVITKN